MGCVYPGAHSPEELWTNVLAGRRYFRKAPPERMPAEYFDSDPSTPDKSYCDKMAVITDWEFDPVHFHIAPNTVRASDLTHWLALYTAEQALLDSAIDLDGIDRTRVGVVLGNSLAGEFSRAHYLRLRWPYIERALRGSLGEGSDELIRNVKAAVADHLPEVTEDTLAGNMSNTITGRICNHYDFGGGAFTVDGACSSSLLSVAMACNALVDGEMDLVLAGGVDVSLDPFEIVGFAKTLALTADDIRPYDRRASGMMTGEGCGIVVLAREEEACTKGWDVRALIKGWGYSSDGRGGITAPGREGQARALARAYDRAGYPMTSVGYIEGHGTGTAVGDDVELSAILSQMEGGGDRGPCRIGSIKANIGHCKAAAGVAGLIKTIMAVQRGVIPPAVNCDIPNALFNQGRGRLLPALDACCWSDDAAPRRASVSAMGFGGANSHVTLESLGDGPEGVDRDLALAVSAQKTELVTLAGRDDADLREQAARLIPVAERISMAELTDLSAAVLDRAHDGRCRAAVVCETPWALVSALERIVQGIDAGRALAEIDSPEDGIFAGRTLESRCIAGVFPGQAAHRVNMGRDFFRRYPSVRDLYAACEERVAGLLPGPLSEYVFCDDTVCSEQQARAWEGALRDTRIAQPAITLTSVAVLQVLRELGLEPEVTLGHSLGKLAALHAAGAMDAETAVHVAALRGDAMASLALDDNGAMAAVQAPAERVEALASEMGSGLVVSNYNAPAQNVVSGSTAAVEAFAERAAAAGIEARLLPVSHAFHSDIVSPAADAFRQALADVVLEPLTGTYVSTHTGRPIAAGEDLHELLAAAIRRPVNFHAAVEGAAELRPTMWVEIGPGGILSGLVRQIRPGDSSKVFTTDYPDTDAHTQINRIVARAFVQGFPVRMKTLFAHRYHKEGFDPDDYHPVFITSPCERGIAASVPARAPAEPGAPQAPAEHTRATATGGAALGSLQDFVIGWIARRTGFPPGSIRPEMKLRDDLNLDSIKVGELALEVARHVGRPLGADPSMWANATIAALVGQAESAARSELSDEEVRESGGAILERIDGLADWARTFVMVDVPAPLAPESRIELPSRGRVVAISEDEALGDALRRRFRSSGLDCESCTPAQATSSDAADVAVVVYVLPDDRGSVLGLGVEEVAPRVEGFAADLFRLCKWITGGREADRLSTRCVVVRRADAVADTARDLDAGAAMLKTLRLEHRLAEDAMFRWIVLPASWGVQRAAETIVDELRHRSRRSAFRYTPDGERWTEVALPAVDRRDEQPPQLGPDDVFLVSGGAKGVTCELALGLARETGVKLALVGSSPVPAGRETAATSEVVRNLERFAAAGVTAEYLQADVTDPVAVRRAVEQTTRRLGRVTGVLHGAGVTELRLFGDMDEESFLRCVRIKATGLHYLLSAVDLQRLKAVHLVSSVLGKTGMRSQADYTYANAWLDGAARGLQEHLSHAHVMTLGYTVWGETGLGLKLESFEFLRKLGVTTLSSEEGVRAYVDLVRAPREGTVFTITGRLTSELEADLYLPRPLHGRPRFLERVLRRTPGTDLVAEATLSHESDLYLAEHVFEGTPMFPGVMAIEAMAQAAMACVGSGEVPEFRNVEFRRPLITPADASVRVRVLALADAPNGQGEVRVRAAVRSEGDGFHESHFAAECWFGLDDEVPGPPIPEIPDVLDVDPESFSPVPLFQGKLFRRIEAIRICDANEKCLTDLRAPDRERYYASRDFDPPAIGSPAVVDSCLQSGALILPPGALPATIAKLCVQPVSDGSMHCMSVVESAQKRRFHVRIHAQDTEGRPVCTMDDLVVELPRAGRRGAAPSPEAPTAWNRVDEDLHALLPDVRFELTSVSHDANDAPSELGESETGIVAERAGTGRQATEAANRLAALRALSAYASRWMDGALDPSAVTVEHRADGKPYLASDDERTAEAIAGLCVTVTDGGGLSVAMVADRNAGIDIEPVQPRDPETWRGLLGEDGYRLTLELQGETTESLDRAATRVWTLIEAGKKCASLQRLVPAYAGALGRSWYAFTREGQGVALDSMSGCVHGGAGHGVLLLAVATERRPRRRVKSL